MSVKSFKILFHIRNTGLRKKIKTLTAFFTDTSESKENWSIHWKCESTENSHQLFDCVVTDEDLGLRLRRFLDRHNILGTPLLLIHKNPAPVYKFMTDVNDTGLADYLPEEKLSAILLKRCIQSLVKQDHLQQEISYLIDRDSSRRLVSSSVFHKQLAKSIATREKNEKKSFAVMAIQINDMNDTPDTGKLPDAEWLLQKVGTQLLECVRRTDLVTRMKDNKFLILLNGIQELLDASRIAQEIIDEIHGSGIRNNGKTVFPNLSIGLYSHCKGKLSPDMVMEKAWQTLSVTGNNEWQAHDPEKTKSSKYRLMLEKALPRALENNEFTVLYQPQIELRNGRITGAEALLRWNNPVLGCVPPSQFIPMATSNEAIMEIDQWVFHEVWRTMAAWQACHRPPFRFSVNLSGKQFDNEHYMQSLIAILAEGRITPGCLEIELTEQNLMPNVARFREYFHEIRSFGVRIALDDFGTGYSFLSHLRDFPADTLKIDRTFIRNLPDSTGDAAIVRAIISLGHDLGMQVVAEGIESEQQLEFLYENGCNLGQGFFFSHSISQDLLQVLCEDHGEGTSVANPVEAPSSSLELTNGSPGLPLTTQYKESRVSPPVKKQHRNVT